MTSEFAFPEPPERSGCLRGSVENSRHLKKAVFLLQRPISWGPKRRFFVSIYTLAVFEVLVLLIHLGIRFPLSRWVLSLLAIIQLATWFFIAFVVTYILLFLIFGAIAFFSALPILHFNLDTRRIIPHWEKQVERFFGTFAATAYFVVMCVVWKKVSLQNLLSDLGIFALILGFLITFPLVATSYYMVVRPK